MPSSVFDSALLRHLWGTDELRAIFSEENSVQKWYDYEAALARAQADLGIIPKAAAAEITGGRIDHGERIAYRDRRIDRVAAAIENVDTNFRGEMLRSDHHALLGGHGPFRSSIGGPNCNQRPKAGCQHASPHQHSTRSGFQFAARNWRRHQNHLSCSACLGDCQRFQGQ